MFLLVLTGSGIRNLGLYPRAVHARFGKDQQELVIDADGFVDLLVNLSAALNIVRGEPAAHAPFLQAVIQPVGEVLIFCAVRNEDTVKP